MELRIWPGDAMAMLVTRVSQRMRPNPAGCDLILKGLRLDQGELLASLGVCGGSLLLAVRAKPAGASAGDDQGARVPDTAQRSEFAWQAWPVAPALPLLLLFPCYP